jgi:hypothetical protein
VGVEKAGFAEIRTQNNMGPFAPSWCGWQTVSGAPDEFFFTLCAQAK